jgi:predicted Fe-S protein YdhL (DUF1289 family)
MSEGTNTAPCGAGRRRGRNWVTQASLCSAVRSVCCRRSDSWAMTAIETPCNKICAIDEAFALCAGCGRSTAEIAGWIGFTAEERRRVMADLPRRLALMHARTPAAAK